MIVLTGNLFRTDTRTEGASIGVKVFALHAAKSYSIPGTGNCQE